MLNHQEKAAGRALVMSICLTLLLYLLFRSNPRQIASPIPPSSQCRVSGASLDDVANSTLGFERIYAINLPSRTDRRDGLNLMSALTGIQLDWIDGVDGNAVQEKALPWPASHETIKTANIGSWRAHLDALRAIVDNNLSTALIIEDDADWDVRIKSQLQDFALSARALLQPLPSSPSSQSSWYADPTYVDPVKSPGMPPAMDLNNLPRTVPPKTSPYGDEWDVLWLGHCGAQFPNPALESKSALSNQLPRGRVVYHNDATVPGPEHLVVLPSADDLRATYPPHTRVTHHAMGSICSLAYAVSQRGARRLLYELGVKQFDSAYDIMLRDVCEGANGRARGVCLTVQPQLFNHHRPRGRGRFHSDISEHADGVYENASTQMIRWSTRMNLAKLVEGRTDFDDGYPSI
ncbi:hypothetical protein FQN53_002862 [Emmonsiellopsis sp. PD_33]|nr:hypothetical protein FQN53_002862 [Emmonsiellopsis sp. PD_33]KAK2802792.1 hypothetical protein FQN51_004320 [Onygenales sp. PD_10]